MSNLCAAAQYLLFVFIVTALVKPSGGYMERGVCRKAVLDRFCCPVERLLYRIAWVDATVEMTFARVIGRAVAGDWRKMGSQS
jgi:K+-transporting ATPase A subunit